VELWLSGFGHHQALKLRHCGLFGGALDQRDFSGQAIKRGSVEPAFAVALSGIDGPSAEIARYFPYRDACAVSLPSTTGTISNAIRSDQPATQRCSRVMSSASISWKQCWLGHAFELVRASS